MRERIIDAALDAYARSDSRGPSFKSIADSVDLTEKGLSHYFSSRDELLLAVLQARDRLSAVPFEPDERGWLSRVVEVVASRNVTQPGLVKLYLDLAVAASEPNHPAHSYFVDRYATLTAQLTELLVRGGRDRSVATWQSEALVAAADGLQIQWLLDPTLDISAAAVQLAHLVESGQATTG